MQADLFNVSVEARTSQSACFQGLRAALRDLLGLPDDDRVDEADRYRPVSEWAATELQAARDFLIRAGELRLMADQLAALADSRLPGVLATTRDELVTKLTEYILSAGTSGSFPQIKALWEDLKDDFRNQYKSEHAGLHAQLLALQQSVLVSREFAALKNFASVEGLSAHYSPVRIESELRQILGQIGVTLVCDPGPATLDQDLNDGWTCSICHYHIGTSVPIVADALLADVQTGLNEYLGQLRAFANDIRTYVTSNPDAGGLLSLLDEPLPDSALIVLADPAMQAHLVAALQNAHAQRIDINDFLTALKPRLLGTYKGGAASLQQRFLEEARTVDWPLGFGRSESLEGGVSPVKVISTKPYVFLDDRDIDELSVHFRECHARLAEVLSRFSGHSVTLADLCNNEKAITYGIVKAGEPVEDGVPMVKVENMMLDGTIDTENLVQVAPVWLHSIAAQPYKVVNWWFQSRGLLAESALCRNLWQVETLVVTLPSSRLSTNLGPDSSRWFLNHSWGNSR